MRIARVFPRKTEASPEDALAFFGPPPEGFSGCDRAEISVAFTYDKPDGEKLAEAWGQLGVPVSIGGPAYDDPGGDFEPGRYLRAGYTITSRGCPNSCWFCRVPKREGGIRELVIKPGHNVLDSNLLACSENHIRRVFDMLFGQKESVVFTGGFEARILKRWHVDLLWYLRPGCMFFAYDTEDDLEPLVEAGKMLRDANFTRHNCRAYVLIGGPKDTMAKAESRLLATWDAGFMPMAMLWKNEKGDTDPEMARFQRTWARPAATKAQVRMLKTLVYW